MFLQDLIDNLIDCKGGSCVHRTKDTFVDILVPAVRLVVVTVIAVHVDIVGLIAKVRISGLLIFRGERRNWRHIRRKDCRASLGSSEAAAQQTDSCGQICLITVITLCSHRPADAGGAPLAMMRKAIVGIRATFRED